MTTEQFRDCLRQLKLSRASARSAAALGLSVRQLQRISGGHTPISSTLAMLMIAYLKRGGVPAPLWDTDLAEGVVLRQATEKLTDLFRRDGKHP
jgi:hypothetical protein